MQVTEPQIDPRIDPIEKIPNGKKYRLNPNMYLVSLRGSPYQMGYAYGKLFRRDIEKKIYWYLDTYFPYWILHPKWREGKLFHKVSCILERVKENSLPYISNRLRDELRGVADGSGIELDRILLYALLPSIFPSHCCIYYDKKYFIRTLDIDPDIFSFGQVLTIYNSTETSPIITIGPIGGLWSFTAISNDHMIGEVGYGINDGNRKGYPFYLFFRDTYDPKKGPTNDNIEIAYFDRVSRKGEVINLARKKYNYESDTEFLIDRKVMEKPVIGDLDSIYSEIIYRYQTGINHIIVSTGTHLYIASHSMFSYASKNRLVKLELKFLESL